MWCPSVRGLLPHAFASPINAPVSSSCSAAVALLFSTDACIPGAAAASRCLLTLKTKHFMFHIDLSFDFLIDYLRIV